jgi:uncharacterized protein YndB with AHSA1/START domain/DNA-binding transcriptional ArsR family regulator
MADVSLDARAMDSVFKALADPTRRLLLDRLREHDGQTLSELSERLNMARQSATQHLDVLERADLVTVVRRGRERLHYLNPTPIHEIEERWISGFGKLRRRAISAVENQAATYVHITYINASAEQVWQALTDADLTARYWGHANVSDWRPGSTWEHQRVDGSGVVDVLGRMVRAEPPTRLVITFGSPGEPSVVTFLVEPHHDIVRLTVTHDNLPNQEMLTGVSHGWPAVVANLKSLLETGEVLPQAPWDMSRAHA